MRQMSLTRGGPEWTGLSVTSDNRRQRGFFSSRFRLAGASEPRTDDGPCVSVVCRGTTPARPPQLAPVAGRRIRRRAPATSRFVACSSERCPDARPLQLSGPEDDYFDCFCEARPRTSSRLIAPPSSRSHHLDSQRRHEQNWTVSSVWRWISICMQSSPPQCGQRISASRSAERALSSHSDAQSASSPRPAWLADLLQLNATDCPVVLPGGPDACLCSGIAAGFPRGSTRTNMGRGGRIGTRASRI
jgi:hypothetical protein